MKNMFESYTQLLNPPTNLSSLRTIVRLHQDGFIFHVFPGLLHVLNTTQLFFDCQEGFQEDLLNIHVQEGSIVVRVMGIENKSIELVYDRFHLLKIDHEIGDHSSR